MHSIINIIVQTNTSARRLLQFSKNIWSEEGFSTEESVSMRFQGDFVNLDDYLQLNKKTPTYVIGDHTTNRIPHSGLLWNCSGCVKGYTNRASFLKHQETCGHNWTGIQGKGSYDWGRAKGNYGKAWAAPHALNRKNVCNEVSSNYNSAPVAENKSKNPEKRWEVDSCGQVEYGSSSELEIVVSTPQSELGLDKTVIDSGKSVDVLVKSSGSTPSSVHLWNSNPVEFGMELRERDDKKNIDEQFSGDDSDIDKDFVPILTSGESDESDTEESVTEKNNRKKKVKSVRKVLVFGEKNDRSKYVRKETASRNNKNKNHNENTSPSVTDDNVGLQATTSSGDIRLPNDRLIKKNEKKSSVTDVQNSRSNLRRQEMTAAVVRGKDNVGGFVPDEEDIKFEKEVFIIGRTKKSKKYRSLYYEIPPDVLEKLDNADEIVGPDTKFKVRTGNVR